MRDHFEDKQVNSFWSKFVSASSHQIWSSNNVTELLMYLETCMMGLLLLQVLVLCFAVFLGSWTPTSLNIGYSKPGLPNTMPFANPQLVKPSPMMGPQIEGAKVDAYCTPPSEYFGWWE